MDGLRYFHIRSSDFYKEILLLAEKHENVTFIQAKVNTIENLDDQSTAVHLNNGKVVYGGKTFNSIPLNQQLESNTLYTTQETTLEELKEKLVSYLSTIFTCSYEILFQEQGAIPMSTKIQGKVSNKNIIDIGSIAGCIKPSTGYTFYDIQKHSEALVQQLVKEEHLYRGWIRKSRFEFYDNILLNIAKKWPESLPSIFAQMFQKNQGQQVLRFLHEETSLWEDLQILARFKFGIFIKSLLHYEKN